MWSSILSALTAALLLNPFCPASVAAVSLVDNIIELEDNTPSGAVLDNLARRLRLDSASRAALSSLKIMNPPNGPESAIVDGLAINSSSGELYAIRKLDRDDLCRLANSPSYGQRRQRRQRHQCCDQDESCELNLAISRPDGETLASRTMVDLRLRLRDVNDNAPSFQTQSVTLNVAEGEPSGTRLSLTGVGSTLIASDPDQGMNRRIDYRLIIGVPGSDLPFRLERDSDGGGFKRLSVVTTRTLDREEKDRYTMHLLAMDSGQPQLTGTLSLTVLITDVNDERPEFEHRTYRAKLAEDAPMGSQVVSVLAIDKDVGQNGAVDYSLAGGSHSALFQVTRTAEGRGVVSLRTRLDAESVKLDPVTGEAIMELILVARDRGSPAKSSEAQLLVTVIDVNDETPEVTVMYMSSDPQRQARGLIVENSPAVVVARIHCRDGDSGAGGEVDCQLRDISGSSEDAISAGGFILQPSSPTSQRERVFNLRATRPLDRELRPIVELAVICADRGRPISLTGSTDVRLRVVDQNDNAPRFLVPSDGAFRFRLPENEPQLAENGGQKHRRSLGHVRAKDADFESADKLVYSLVPGAPASVGEGAFQIDPSTGELFAVRPFDREDPRLLLNSQPFAIGRAEVQVTLQVFVRDSNPAHNDTANVVVTIEDKNDNAPRFDRSEYTFRVAENAKDYRQVGTVTATDADESDAGQIEYRIDKEVEHEVRRHFGLDQSTGTLSLRESLDRETRGSYVFRVLAIDGKNSAGQLSGNRAGGLPSNGVRNTGTATVTVEVTDVNDCEPRILQPTEGQVLELPVGTPAGHPLIEAKAIDSDLNENGAISYSLVDGAASGLDIDKTSGTLFATRAVSRRQPGQSEQFSLTIEARDHGSPNSLRATVRVWIRIVDSTNVALPQDVGRNDGVEDIQGGSSMSASQRVRAAIVIGLIAFFFLLLVLAAVAALILLRPCRQRQIRRQTVLSAANRQTDKIGDLPDDDDNDEAMKEARLMTAPGGVGLTARQLAVGSLHGCNQLGPATAVEHYNLIPSLAHSIDGGSSLHHNFGTLGKGGSKLARNPGNTLPISNSATAAGNYQVLRPLGGRKSQQQQQQQQPAYYQIAAAATLRRGEADGGLASDVEGDFEATTMGLQQIRWQQQQQQQQQQRSKPQNPSYDPRAGASFV